MLFIPATQKLLLARLRKQYIFQFPCHCNMAEQVSIKRPAHSPRHVVSFIIQMYRQQESLLNDVIKK